MKGHIALVLVLLCLSWGCASHALLPIEVSSRADLWVRAHPPTPEDSSVPRGRAHFPHLVKLRAWAIRHGYSIEYEDLSGGAYVGMIFNRHIRLDLSLTPDGELNTLLHELAHDLIPFAGTHGEREVVAEVVAYMVAQNLSWHTSESLGYISSVPSEHRARTVMKYEKEILKVVGVLTAACR